MSTEPYWGGGEDEEEGDDEEGLVRVRHLVPTDEIVEEPDEEERES